MPCRISNCQTWDEYGNQWRCQPTCGSPIMLSSQQSMLICICKGSIQMGMIGGLVNRERLASECSTSWSRLNPNIWQSSSVPGNISTAQRTHGSPKPMYKGSKNGREDL